MIGTSQGVPMDTLLASFGLLGPLIIFAVIWSLSCLKVINQYE